LEPANRLLEAHGQPPLPTRLTTHGLRHTFASVLTALGEDPVSVMAQLGHTDPAFSLRVYTHMMRRGPDERERLRALTGRRQRGKGSLHSRYAVAAPLGRSLRKLRGLMTSKANRLS
jgi:Phage integrase family.